MESYNNIQENQNKKMFSNDRVTMKYRDFVYTGNLNELMDVILSDIFRLTHNLQK